ncbi:hypothetical protein C4J81_16935 [Deltaproteobacteria bacterium Smac51]|nr:hypothetical protein C4J81_16935 [Deltaproteobacteria bacterium Smac51]
MTLTLILYKLLLVGINICWQNKEKGVEIMKKIMVASMAMVLGLMLLPALAMASPVTVHNNTGSTIVGYAYSDSGRNTWHDVAMVKEGMMPGEAAVEMVNTPMVPIRIGQGQSFVLDVPNNYDRFDLRVVYEDESRHEYMNLKNSHLPNIRLNSDEAVMY